MNRRLLPILGIFSLLLGAIPGCTKRQSLAQMRLSEWLPPSATEVYSDTNGQMKDTTFIAFVLPAADLEQLQKRFAAQYKAHWSPLPLDKRSSGILDMAVSSLKIKPELQPPRSQSVKSLVLPETGNDAPAGDAIILDSAQNRFWYIESEM